MDCRGYSRRIVDANKSASLDSLGVRLGRLCIKEDISVAAVAETFRVSRTTVYNWFAGAKIPRKSQEDKILYFIKNYKPE
jgi:DNA-binding transcriptional regulator YiaG